MNATANQANNILKKKTTENEVVVIQYQEPIQLGLNDKGLQTLKVKMKKLLKAPLETVGDYQKLTKGIAECRNTRTSIDHQRKELKAPVLEYGRKLDAEAKRLMEALAALEEPLREKKAAEDERKAQIKLAKAREEVARVEKINGRILEITKIELQAMGCDKADLVNLQEALAMMEVESAADFYSEFLPQAQLAHGNAYEAINARYKFLDDQEADELARELEEAELKAAQEELKQQQDALNKQKQEQEAREAALQAKEDEAWAAESAREAAKEEAALQAQKEADQAKADRADKARQKRVAKDLPWLEAAAVDIELIFHQTGDVASKEGKAAWKMAQGCLEDAAAACRSLDDDLPWGDA